jgi:hypothetical protein
MNRYEPFPAFAGTRQYARPLTFLCAAALAALTLLPGAAAGQNAFEGEGIVSEGRCAAADVFTDSSGNQFEIDRSRAKVPRGVPIRVTGSTYRRISVCKVHPWLDVAEFSPAVGNNRKQTAPQLEVGSVLITVRDVDIHLLANVLIALGRRPDIQTVNVVVEEGRAAMRLPEVFVRLADENPELASKLQVEVQSSPKAKYQWKAAAAMTSYQSLQEMRNAMALR